MHNKLLLLFALSSIMLLGTNCSKQVDKPKVDESLQGNWEWVRTDGGFNFHIHETPANTGQNIIMKFSAGKKYYIYVNDSLTYQGTYRLESRKCIHDDRDKTVIFFSSPSEYDFMIERMDRENLEFSDEAVDGSGSLYKRKINSN